MKMFIRALVVLVFLIALFSFAFTYTVKFTETAVKTRFGEAGPNAVHADPGLFFRLPYPIDSVTTYDKRVRTLALKIEQQQTADSKQIGVEAFCTWRVSDPLSFFRRFSNAGERPEEHYRRAEESLSTAMRSAMGVVSKYSMDDLFTTSAEGTKLTDLENRVLASLRSPEDKSTVDLKEYGIEVVGVGVMRVVLPEETTKAVFDRMKSARTSITKQIESRGTAEAQAIRAKAESDARKIKDFAQALASDLRARGDQESVAYFARMNENSQLAVFLAQTEFLKSANAKRTTLVLASDVPGINLLFPEAMKAAENGKIPALITPKSPSPSIREGVPAGTTPAILGGGR